MGRVWTEKDVARVPARRLAKRRAVKVADLAKEADVKLACQQYLDLEWLLHFRMNAGQVIVVDPQYLAGLEVAGIPYQRMTLAPEGTADELVQVPAGRKVMEEGCTIFPIHAQPLWLEYKRPRGTKLSTVQIAFRERVLSEGALHAEIRSVGELMKVLPPRRKRFLEPGAAGR